MALRPYQTEAVSQILQAFNTYNRVLYQLPTGGGKTVILADLINHVQGNVWILVHRKELIQQTLGKLHEDASIISAEHKYIEARVSIAMIQSLVRREGLKSPDLIIIDEAHRARAGSYLKILEKYPNAKVLGVTATPRRLDGKGLGDIFQHLILGPTVRELIDQGYLADYYLYGAPKAVSLYGVSKRAGDYNLEQLAEVMGDKVIVGNSVDEYKKHLDGKQAIVFAVTVEHSKYIAECFKAAGIPAAHLDGETPTERRDSIIQQFKEGKILVLTNCQLFTEGFDVPNIEGVIILRPTLSLAMYKQMVGRALRPKANGSRAIILDHATNYKRHDLPDDDVEWSLEGKPPKPSLGIKDCPICYAVVSSFDKECKHCNYSFAVRGAEIGPREIKITEVAAELQLIEKSAGKDKYKKCLAWAREGKTFLERHKRLKEIQKANGYKNGWVWRVEQEWMKQK